jgi:hypothetical protein
VITLRQGGTAFDSMPLNSEFVSNEINEDQMQNQDHDVQGI